MPKKEQLRKKYYKIRKNKYFEVTDKFFNPLFNLLDKFFKKKQIRLSFYYPSNYEVNTLNLFNVIKRKKNIKALLPVINPRNQMVFVKWDLLDSLKVNKYGKFFI